MCIRDSSCIDEVQPLRKMKRALADERARRRRHEVAQREPTIFDAFAIHEGVEDLVIESDPPGLKTTRWLEAPDAKALREDKDAALDRAIQKLEKAADGFNSPFGPDHPSKPEPRAKKTAAFSSFWMALSRAASLFSLRAFASGASSRRVVLSPGGSDSMTRSSTPS